MRSILILAAFVVLAGGCKPRNDASRVLGANQSAYDRALAQAADDLELSAFGDIAPSEEIASMLAQDTSTYSTFQKLRKRHSALFFVVDRGQKDLYRRSASASDPIPDSAPVPVYSVPIEYAFNANLLVSCKNFLAEPGFKDLNKQFFASIPETEDKAKLYCASIRFDLVDDKRSTRDKGDVANINLYVDSKYRSYGLDLFRYIDKSQTSKVSFQLDSNDSVSSRMDFVPYDLPNLYAVSRMVAKKKNVPTAKMVNQVSPPGDTYVARVLAKRGIQICPHGKAVVMTYDEKFGVGTQTVTWCQGDAWPSVVQNEHYLIVLAQKP